jgi:hypothetical protein
MSTLSQSTVIGFVPIIAGRPGFVTPVLTHNGNYYIQNVTFEGAPVRTTVALDARVEILREPVNLATSGRLLYGFYLDKEMQIFGEKAYLARCLRDFRERFEAWPMLLASVEAFIGLERLLDRDLAELHWVDRTRSEAAPDAQAAGVGIRQLRDGVCHFPVGDPASAEFSFCGKAASTGPYCEDHRRLTYMPSTKRRRRGEPVEIPLAFGSKRVP